MSVAAQKTVTNARHTPSVVAILLTKDASLPSETSFIRRISSSRKPTKGGRHECLRPLPARFDYENCTSVLSLSVYLDYQSKPERVTTALPCG